MFLYALQGERNPKHGPQSSGAGRVSPLAVEVWKVLEREGALTADELRERVGREITEAAVLRALSELWHGLRVAPAPGENDEPAQWEPLSARHRKAIASGSTQSQTTALSMLVSYYLRSAIIATGEEIELFLSPVTSRSRVRDVLRGLSANRQLGTLSLGTQMHFYVEGTLPEFVEEETAAMQADAGLEGNEPDMQEVQGDVAGRGRAGDRAERAHTPRPQRGARPERPAYGDAVRSRPAFGQRARRPSFGERSQRPSRPSFRRAEDGGAARAPRGAEGADRGNTRRSGGFGARRNESAEEPAKRFGGTPGFFKSGRAGKPFNKPGGAPFLRKEAGPGGENEARPPFRGAGGDRPQRPAFTRGGSARPGTGKFGTGDRRPVSGPGERSDRSQARPRSFEGREGAPRREGTQGREGGRPPQRREAGGRFGGRAERPARRPFDDRNREGGSFKPRTPRAGGNRPSSPPREGEPREGQPREDRPALKGRGDARGSGRSFRPASFRPKGSGSRHDQGTRPPRRESGERSAPRSFGDRSSFKTRAPRSGGDRPSFPRREDGPRREERPRRGDRPAEGAGAPRSFKPRDEGSRPPRREGGFGEGPGAGSSYKGRGARPASGSGARGARFAGPRSAGSGSPGSGPAGSAPRKSFGGPKRGGSKPGARPGGPGVGGFKPPKRKGSRGSDGGRSGSAGPGRADGDAT